MTQGSAVPLLSVRHVEFAYRQLKVLFDVSIEVPPAGRVALLGTNGAGKSTLLRVLGGLGLPSSGAVEFDGHDITRWSPEDRAGLGLVSVAGGRSTFPSLTVRENIRIGAYPFRTDRRLVARRLDEVLEVFPSLVAHLDHTAGTLSGGQQQMMAIARALIAKPLLLVIDELSLGLAPIVVSELIGVLGVLADAGTALLVVEQSLNVAAVIADTAYFMEKGEVRYRGPIQELVERGDLVRSVFLGAPDTGSVRDQR